MLDKLVLPSDILQARKADLRDDGAELATRGRNSVCRRAVPRGEHLSGNDERGRVGAEVLEEVGEAVEEDERLRGRRSRGKFVVTEACAPTPSYQPIATHISEDCEPTHDNEKDGKHDETHELDRFAAP